MAVVSNNTNVSDSFYGQYADNTYKARQTGDREFAQVVKEKEQTNKYRPEVDFDEEAFNMVGPNAPQNVKDAWMEAAKEVNANGMGIKKNGMMSHISQMMVQRVTRMLRGENVDIVGVLGYTTESAIRATRQALYDLDHPLAYTPKSTEVMQARMKEREFYVAFLDKLQGR